MYDLQRYCDQRENISYVASSIIECCMFLCSSLKIVMTAAPIKSSSFDLFSQDFALCSLLQQSIARHRHAVECKSAARATGMHLSNLARFLR
jgi:hypothetical protein